MPVSFKGKLIQYAGRLHRAHPGKTEVVIHDYLDASSALTVSMFRKRLVAYKKMDYQVEADAGSRASRISSKQIDIFVRPVVQNSGTHLDPLLGSFGQCANTRLNRRMRREVS